jgi:L,D-transpeptidase ErfK/SrfK
MLDILIEEPYVDNNAPSSPKYLWVCYMFYASREKLFNGVGLGLFLILTFYLVSPAGSGTYRPSWPILTQIQGGEQCYLVRSKDSLYSIAGRFGTTWQHLAEKNRFSPPYKLSLGQKLVVNNRRIFPGPQNIQDGLLLNIPEHGLYLIKQGVVVKRYPVGLGRPDWPTPTGQFSVMNKAKNPTWTIPKSIQEELKREGKFVKEKIPPGPDNPLGSYWIALSVEGYGIHATIWPESIGHSTSHGCIRMITEDIDDLFRQVGPGTPIQIVYEPLKLAQTADEKIYLEAHSNTYQLQFSYWKHLQGLADQQGLSDRIDWSKAALVLNERNGIAEEITRK